MSYSGPQVSFSSFKNCLESVPVPDQLLAGVQIMRVTTNGKLRHSILKLSPDKFTLYISSIKGSSPTKSFMGSPVSPQSSTSTNILRPILRKISSGGGTLDDDADDNFTIDIPSIYRVQRGQTTIKFELARKTGSKAPFVPLHARIYPLVNSVPLNDMPAQVFDILASFSIIHSGGCTVDLILLHDPEESRDTPMGGKNTPTRGLVGGDVHYSCEDIARALERLCSHLSLFRSKVGNDIYLLRYYWEDIDKDQSDALNATKLALLLDRINYKKADSLNDEYNKFTKLLELSKAERKRGLTFDQCATFLHKVKRDTWQVKPVHQIWINLFGEIMSNGKHRTQVSAASFLSRFLQRKQNDRTSTIQDVRTLFKTLNKLEIAKVASHALSDDDHIDKDRFEAYLLSTDNDIFDPSREVYKEESLNQPLAEYWIHSSHNTYLTGDQLYSRSSVETYYSALYRGVRCVEVDCWDGEKDVNETPIPIVYHGHTMTSKIPLCDVVESINDFLIQNPTSLPVIISLENHCSLPYQEVMAKLFIQIFSDRLYIPTDQSLQGNLPSPNSLKGMVLIKGRRLTESLEEELGSENILDDTTLEDDDSTVGISDVLLPTEVRELPYVNSADAVDSILCPELSRITLFHKRVLKDFIDSSRTPTFHMHSFVESKVRKLCRRRDNSDWIWFNTDHITRTYPSGKRVDSSNYSPIPAWAMGCQMVALNTQHYDYALSLNDGRFRVNGSCGYVLKPPLHIKTMSTTSWTLLVKVLSGTCLPKPRGDKKAKCIDPFVKVCVYDIPTSGGNEICTSFSTSTVLGNGYFPIWNHDFFTFRVENPPVAMLSFSVHDKDDEYLASASIPVDCLRVGYRSVRLFDALAQRWGPFSCASLLVEIEIRIRDRGSPSMARD